MNIEIVKNNDNLLEQDFYLNCPRMDESQYNRMIERFSSVYENIPGSIFLGGLAMRIWADKLNMVIPAEFGGDVDITKRGVKEYEVNKETAAGWVDIFPSAWSIEEPFFTKTDYKGRR